MMLAFWSLLPAFAADEPGAWFDLDLEARIHDRVEVAVSQSSRTEPGQRQLLLTPEVKVRVSDHFRVAAAYRIGAENDGQWGGTHRAHADAVFRTRLGRVRLDARQRLQVRLPLSGRREKWTTRTRLRATFRPKDVPLQPRLSVEPFFDFRGAPLMDRLRLDATLRWVPGDWTVSATYRVEIYPEEDRRLHLMVLGVGYELDLRKDE